MKTIFDDVLASSRSALLSAATTAAAELGLFLHLNDGATAPDLARRCGFVHNHRLDALLGLLVAEQVIGEHTGCFYAGEVPETGPSIGDGWGRLAELIRTDTCLEVPLAPGHHQYLAVLARELGPQVFAGFEDAASLIDVGGGIGGYSLAFTQTSAHRTARLIELPEVAALAEVHLADEPRVAICPGNFFDVVGEMAPAHIVLLANVVHLYGPAEAARFVRLAAGLVAPGGHLVVKELVAEAGLAAAYFAVNMAVYTPAGRVYSAGQLAHWCKAASLSVVAQGPRTVGTRRVPGAPR